MPRKIRHDQLFKLVASRRSAAREVLKLSLDQVILQELDLDNLEMQKDSYVDESLKAYFADLVFTCKSKKDTDSIKISFIFEHKSYVEPFPHVQLLKYLMNAFSRQLIEDTSRKKLMPVIPIIFFHGKKSWEKKTLKPTFNYPTIVFKNTYPIFNMGFLI